MTGSIEDAIYLQVDHFKFKTKIRDRELEEVGTGEGLPTNCCGCFGASAVFFPEIYNSNGRLKEQSSALVVCPYDGPCMSCEVPMRARELVTAGVIY